MKINSVEGTKLSNITQRTPTHNTTGYKGVCYDKKSGKYMAYIMLRYKQKTLGRFSTIEEAVKARQRAEEEFFQPILDKYKEK